jgi:hypothetical protein
MHRVIVAYPVFRQRRRGTASCNSNLISIGNNEPDVQQVIKLASVVYLGIKYPIKNRSCHTRCACDCELYIVC